jgi:hypothetical protein
MDGAPTLPSKRRSSKHQSKRTLNGWTDERNYLIGELGNEASTFRWLHKKSSLIISKLLDNISVTAAILSTITSGSSLISFITSIFSDSKWVVNSIILISFILSTIAAILLVVQNQLKLPEKITHHKDAEQDYYWIYFKIQSQLQIPVTMRENGVNFYDWVSYAMNKISRIEDIEDNAISIYRKEFPQDAIPNIDGIRKIVNHDETPTDETSEEDNGLKQTPPDNIKININDSPNRPSTLGNTNNINFLKNTFRTRRDMILSRATRDSPPSYRTKLDYEIHRSRTTLPSE